MASIENRSRFVVSVQKHEDLTKTLANTREDEAISYIAKLKASGHTPKLSRTDDRFAVRVRDAGYRKQCIYASKLARSYRHSTASGTGTPPRVVRGLRQCGMTSCVASSRVGLQLTMMSKDGQRSAATG
jgi:hypothetical protein